MSLKFSTRFIANVCTKVLIVSLILESTNILVKGSIEASSPEERHENDLPLSGLIPTTSTNRPAFSQTNSISSPTNTTKVASTNLSSLDFYRSDLYSNSFVPLVDFKRDSLTGSPLINPLLTEGVFPYQPNALAAVVAAGLTMAVMSLKETGKIDFESIGYILNSTDFYAGLLGTFSASVTHKQTTKAIAAALSRGASKGPDVLKPYLNSTQAKLIGNIINGFTYTFAISSGFEYFSQVWKHVTRNIPEAQKLSGFFKTDSIRKKQVALNLMYYLVVDTNMQKRILSSVYNHRILTFEFIATNVAMYIGGQLGSILSAKYGAKTPWLMKIGPVIGSISGGLMVQAIPSSWTSAANSKLVDMKIASHEAALRKNIRQVQEGVKNYYYPSESNSRSGYWVRGADLESDLERILAERDMIASLQLQKAMGQESGRELFHEVQGTFLFVESTVRDLLDEVHSHQISALSEQIQKWMSENRSVAEIQRLGERFTHKSPALRYYEILLDATLDRCRDSKRITDGLIGIIGQDSKLDPAALSVFGFQ